MMLKPSSSFFQSLRSFVHHRHFFPFSTVSAEISPSPPDFIVEYLVKSCGLSREHAVESSKILSHLKSTKNPDSVLSFLRKCGLNDSHIKKLISARPRFLCSSVKNTLEPRFKHIQELGFSGSDLLKIIQKNPFLFLLNVECYIKPRIAFLRSLLSSDAEVVQSLTRFTWLLAAQSQNFEKRMLGNISVLQTNEIADKKIRKLLTWNPQYLLLQKGRLQDAINRAENDLGIPRSSGMFYHAMIVFCSNSKSTLESKFRLLESFGWSESDQMTMFRNLPYCFALSEEKMKKGLEYLMKKAGFEASYLSQRPKLLMYNLETRVVPRHVLLNGLYSENLLQRKPDLHTVVCWKEQMFVEAYVEKFGMAAPHLCEAYKRSMEVAKRRR